MIGNNEYNDLETKIIEVARDLFIEKGFDETSMSEIAAKVGINRPVLHYYYRTKDKIFKAVFGMIIQTIIPKIRHILPNSNEPISKRIENIIDTYYAVFRENPYIPLFVCREMHRDTDFLIAAIESSQINEAFCNLAASLQEEMTQGKLKQVPLRIVFLNFYSLLTFPFLTKDFDSRILLQEQETFDMLLAEWKPYMVSQMINLLGVKE